MKKHLLKTLLVGVMTLAATGAWAQTWTFVSNTDVWGADGVTLNGGAQYDENANAVTSGGVTFTGTSGFVATAKGIGFNATGSTTDENISVVVPAGWKATVTVYTSGNRTVVGELGETSQTFNAAWAASTKEFSNGEGTEDVTLYLYCNQNPGGAEQNKAPFLEKIELVDMASVKSFPWTANAVATIGGAKTTIKTYASEADVDEGSQYTVIVEKMIKYEDNYYVLNDDQFAENVYGKTFTMGGAAAELEINYEAIENVAFYGEVEDIYAEGKSANKQENISVLSNGGGYSAMSSSEGYVKLAFSVPETAVYKLVVGMNNTNSRERGFNYAIDDADASETITVASGAAFVQEIADQTLTAGEHTITLNMTYSLTPVFDYLLVIKTGDVTPEPVLNTYTATFTTSAEWEKVYAYAFTTTGEGEEATTTEFLGAWPGTELTKNAETGLYEVTIEAAEAPEFIIFNNGNDGEGNQTENLAFENEKAYEYTVVIPATDIEISPAEGDIAAALAAAEEGIENIGNISIKLTEGVTYTVSSTLTAYKNFEIQGNGAVIDASELEGNLVEMYAEKNEEGNVINPEAWTAVEYVSFHNATIKGLKKALFYSGVKQYDINWLTINNCYIELAADATTIDFTKGSVARNFNVEYSTIYAPTATTKQFYSSQSGQKATEAASDAIQSFIFKSSTLYNLVPGKNFFSHRQSNQTWLTYDVQNNIFVNCGKSGQVIKGMNGGQSGKNPTWIVKNNIFNFNGADTSADEATGDDEEAVEGSIAGVVTFTDADNGDFNGEFTLAAGTTVPETTIGAPMWNINYKEAEPVINYYVVGSMTSWKIDEDYLMTLNEGAEGVEEYKLTVELENGDEIKVVKAVNGEITTWYPDGEGNNYTITADKEYNIYFRPNADGGDDWHYKVLYVVDTETDGINSLSIDMQNAAVYDLQGRRVQNAQKGLYIVNGKKVVKN